MNKPLVYVSTTWHSPIPRGLTLIPAQVLDALRRTHGSVPARLDTEPLVIEFANHALIPLAERDIEDALFHPHHYFGSRAWVREEYQRFLGWCRQSGWLATDEALDNPDGETSQAQDADSTGGEAGDEGEANSAARRPARSRRARRTTAG